MLSVSTPHPEAAPGPSEDVRSVGRRPGWLAGTGLILLGAALLWLVIGHSYTAYLAGRDPEASLKLRVTALALLNLAEQRFTAMRNAESVATGGADKSTARADTQTGADTRDRLSVLAELASRRFSGGEPAASAEPNALTPRSAEKERLYQMVREALRREPMNARGLRLLGELSEGHAPREEVAALMRMAVRRNVHEPIAVFWLLNEAVAQRNHAETITYANILLRTEVNLVAHAVHALAKASEDPEGLTQVLQVLRADPPWRQLFVSTMSRYVTDARIPLQILVGLKDSSKPPTSKELAPFFGLLLSNKLYELAYYSWIQFLPPDQLTRVQTPYNGDFETAPSGFPFDWTIPSSPNAIAGIVPATPPAEGKALRVEFGLGRIEFSGVSQTLLLSPGAYTFSASHTTSINGRRGLVWSLKCIEGKELGRTAMMVGNVSKPTRIEFQFTVPDGGCRAQQLTLLHDSRSASEQFASGWSNQQDVRITRREDAP